MESQIKSRVKIFPKVEHGWTTRYNDEDEAACKAAEEAHQDLLEWLLNYVKWMVSSLLWSVLLSMNDKNNLNPIVPTAFYLLWIRTMPALLCANIYM